MAEGRMLKRKAATDRRLAQLSSEALVLFLMSIPHLDVDGKMVGSPAAVRGTVIPALVETSPSTWTDTRVASYIAEWTATSDEESGLPRPLVLHYCVRGAWVCKFPGFEKNQRIQRNRERPSSLPDPPPMLIERLESGDAVSPNQLVLDADSGISPAAASPPDAGSGAAPEPLRAKAEAEVEVQELPDQRGPSRAREGSPDLAALPDRDLSEDPLAGLGATVARRREALASHGPLSRLLEVLHDADEQTPRVLHELYDPLGEEAIELARVEVLSYGAEIRRPSAYAVGIARRLAAGRASGEQQS